MGRLNTDRSRGTKAGGPPGGILTIGELSAYLKISKSTLYKLAQEGKVPAKKVGRHWRFHREGIDRWLQGRAGETTTQ